MKGRHITGNGEQVPLDTRYERLGNGGGKGWAMVTEIGAQARTGMFADGIQAYVSVRELGLTRWTYVVGRMSNFIQFDCQKIFDACNRAEFKQQHESGEPAVINDHWGGSDMIGGSPRVGGSQIPPSVLVEIINEITG